ncbi:MAG: MFS transporter [Planctomycetaceae bacterium]|nr:MFS transporter [Planctomycetaceae bacterium]
MTSPHTTADESTESIAGARFVPLATLFACIYFIQGIAEPTQGLIAQPVRSLLISWGNSAAAIGTFMGIVGLPWSIKPLFGLIADFVPLGRASRRNWLILMTAMTSGTLGWLAFQPPQTGDVRTLLLLLLAPTIGIAFTDVLADSLMVEQGQARGWTGRLQSVQWTSLNAASIVAGSVGGLLSQYKQQHRGFLICAIAAGCTLLLAVFWRSPAGPRPERPAVAERARVLWRALQNGPLLAAAAFLFLWSFNPFSMTVQQLYMTDQLGLSPQFYGGTLSLTAFAWMLASAAYAFYCRRLSPRRLVQLSIVTGVATTLFFLGLRGEKSALLIAGLSGLTYMTGLLIQLDLAARVCPPAVAGTLFALLMSLSNLGVSGGEVSGGWLYERWTAAWGAHVAFDALVGVGALTTATCWLLTPWLVAKEAEG